MCAVLAIGLAASALAGAQPTARSSQQTRTAESYRRARTQLKETIQALGGPAVTSFHALELRYSGTRFARGQSASPNGPSLEQPVSGRFVYEQNGRQYHENSAVILGGTDRSHRRVLDDSQGWHLWVSRKTLSELSPNDVALLKRSPAGWMESTLPHSLVAMALARPAALRWLGEEERAGSRVARIGFTDAVGTSFTLVIDGATDLPTAVETMASDLLLGDAMRTVLYDTYESVDGLQVPRRLEFRINDQPLQRWKLDGVRLLDAVDDAVFERPADVVPVEYAPSFRPRQLAPGVWAMRLYSGPANTYNTLLVDVGDSLVVIEAPLTGLFRGIVQRVASQLAPGKPIRHVVTTHHHHDHSGGIRAWLGSDTTIHTGPQTAEFIRRVASAQHTLTPQAPVAPENVRLDVVTDTTTIGEGANAVRLVQVGPAPHVDDMLIAYLPGARLVFVSDLFAVPDGGWYPAPSPSFEFFAATLDRLGWEVDTFVSGHGLVGTPADLEAALAGPGPTRTRSWSGATESTGGGDGAATGRR